MPKFKRGDPVFIHRQRLYPSQKDGFLRATIEEFVPTSNTYTEYYNILLGGVRYNYCPETILYSTEEAMAETLAR